jgi:hypothetical protein
VTGTVGVPVVVPPVFEVTVTVKCSLTVPVMPPPPKAIRNISSDVIQALKFRFIVGLVDS